jgi:hypothetical protein
MPVFAIDACSSQPVLVPALLQSQLWIAFCRSPVPPVLSICSVSSFDSSPALARHTGTFSCTYHSCDTFDISLWESPNPTQIQFHLQISPQSTPVTLMAQFAIRVRILFAERSHVFSHDSSKCFCCFLKVGLFLAGSTPGTLLTLGAAHRFII